MITRKETTMAKEIAKDASRIFLKLSTREAKIEIMPLMPVIPNPGMMKTSMRSKTKPRIKRPITPQPASPYYQSSAKE